MFGVVPLGRYQINIEGRQFRANLAYQNDPSMPNARVLYITLTWQDTRQSTQTFHLSTLSQTVS
jgi:hypothetical protein